MSAMDGEGGGGGFSEELKRIQRAMHEHEGSKFDSLQRAFRGVEAWRAKEVPMGSVETPSSSTELGDKEKLARAIQHTLDLRPSPQVLEEVSRLCGAGVGGKLKYKDFADLMWSDDVLFQRRGRSGTAKSATHGKRIVSKHLFIPLQAAGFYNDNVPPKATISGVKKVSSSVRYDVFSNSEMDRSTHMSQVPPAVLEQVESSLHMLPSRHGVTGRPLDPYLSYLTVAQGRKIVPPISGEVPINILSLKPRLNDKSLPYEWKMLPTFSLSFTSLHSGLYKNAERRNKIF